MNKFIPYNKKKLDHKLKRELLRPFKQLLYMMKKVKKWLRILSAIKFRNHDLQKPGNQNLKFYTDAQKILTIKIVPSIFPYYIHRTILWDSQEPLSLLPVIETVKKHTKEYQHIMWNTYAIDKLVLSLYNHSHFYFQYSKKIMQADFARYLILYQYGGAYFDLDIKMNTDLNSLIGKAYQNRWTNLKENGFCILFEEHRYKNSSESVNEKKQPIRNFLDQKYYSEALIRVANYAIIATPKHPFIKQVINTCIDRAYLTPKNNYDVLFITGPDVVSHVYEISNKDFLQKHNVLLVPKEDHNKYIEHLHHGQWRDRD